jgi:hypothetical protein
MDREYFIQLTLGLYRVTEMLPDKEPLKFKLREKANDILAVLASVNFDVQSADQEAILRDISVISIYFEIAQEQGWIDSRNFLVLKQGYANLRELSIQKKFLQKNQDSERNNESRSQEKEYYNQVNNQERTKKIQEKFKNTEKIAKTEIVEFPERKGEIYGILNKKGPLRLIQMLQYFPEVSKRTIRRDLAFLVRKNAIQRYDKGKLTFYRVKNT